ncbi:MAG: orotidine-5'-phosphate decarboxylase, partial [Nitrososphaera sp.]|nr:orotidine-5'-phosphate decarboxylase [Nitrososphaera sp.]
MLSDKGIIFAADIDDRRNLLETISRVDRYIDAVKLGNQVLYEFGWKIVSDVKRICSKPIIADLKLMDVPHIAERICTRAKEMDVDAIMLCGATGLDTLGYCRACFPGMIFIVTQFTHCQDVIPDNQADSVADNALKLGCEGVQVPATYLHRVRHIRELVGEDAILISCGVGRQGPEAGSAIAAGADFEIIGREIYANAEAMTAADAARLARERISKVLAHKENKRP